MLTVEKILEMVGDARSPRMRLGALAAVERFPSYPGGRAGSLHTPAGHRFFREMNEALQGAADNPVEPSYAHPVTTAMGATTRKPGPLQPVEIAWLGTLSRNPEHITYDDAVNLAVMTNSISRHDHPTDARLVDVSWRPVKALHDLRQAQREVVRLQQTPAVRLPSSIVDVLIEAVSWSTTELSDSEVVKRARSLLDAATEQVKADRAQHLEHARADLSAAEAQLAELTRTSAQAGSPHMSGV